ncbi:uncharacterized protein LOC122531392 [Frieseomelitta varia]|uniref:uncharacterized protein LOC122531392 n=1 Tax=Frieseomelitta varia TaxID=561572 RepID=UPI001CB68C80|nr:uncharacterized protein LOC122531392 [Frieseomelitta varia]
MSEMDYIIVPRIPRGLAPAVEGLAREILRQRPRNIYAFAAEHFAELVKLRDKERTGEVVSKILQHKLLNKRDSIVDWAKLDNGNKNDVDVAEVCDDHFHILFHKYDNSMEEAMVTREAKKSTKTWRIGETRKAAPAASKRKGERAGSGSKSGWSINRAVKAVKQHREYRAMSSDIEQKYEEDCNKGLINGKETEKVVADYPDHPDCPDYPFVRSSSAGNIMHAKRVKSRGEVGENVVEKFCTVATLDDKSYRNEKNLTRQKSADQIERTCMYFKDICTNEDADVIDVDIADRKRSRSLVNNEGRNEWNVREKARRQHVTTEGRMARNWKDEWRRSVMEDQRKEQEKFREKFDDAREDDATLNLQLEKRNDKVRSREVNEMGEAVVNDVESRPDLSKSNTMFDDSTNEIPNVGTTSVVLPLVVRRQSSGKCTRNNVRERYEYESNGEDGAGNFTLPPISSDGSKSMRKGSNLLVELPSLSNDVDARSNEQAIHHHRHHCEDSTFNSSRIQKRSDSELFKLEGVTTVEIAGNSDCSREAIEKKCNDQDSRDDVNVHDIVSRKYPRESKSVEGSETLLTTGNIIEQDVDETQIPQQSGCIQRPRSNSSEEAEEIRETWKDSLSVSPDSIDLSEKTNSSKRLESERKKNGEREIEREEGNERQERYPEPNELERKLIEIETMEKSIENTLVSSRTISNDFDNEFGGSERSIEFSTRNVEPDCARNEQVASRVDDEWTKKNSDKSQSATSNESNEDNDDNIEIENDSVENEMSIRKRSELSDSDNSGTFINDQDSRNNDSSDDSTNVGEIKRCSRSTRGIDVSCYVLTEGSPCEIPETVTTVIIPDNVYDNVCKIELDDSTGGALDQFAIPSTWNSEIETKEEGRHGVEHCQEQNPFGEYIGPETIVHYSSSVDAHFLRDVKDAADRVSAYQEDLANIKEEEENEDDRFSMVVQRSSTVDRPRRGRIVDASEKSAESMKRQKSIECEAKVSTSFSRDQQQNKMDGKEETSACLLSNISDPSSKRDYAKHTAKNDNLTKTREEEERRTFDDRSSDVSLSFEQGVVGPTINVPELNLDSLQDVTISSTIGESDSKNLLSNENGNVISSEDENISLSSFDALASSGFNERKLNDPNDETLSFENDRARPFSEPITEMTKTGNETESYSEFQRTEKFSNERDEKDEGNESRYVEEEIARELIRNFIIDNTKVVESNDSMKSSLSPKPRANNTKPNQAEDFVIQFHPSVQDPSASKVAIGEISSHCRGKLDNDTRADCEKGKGREKDEKTSEEGREARENEEEGNEASIMLYFSSFLFLFFFAPPSPPLSLQATRIQDEMMKMAFSEKERKKEEIAHGFSRHTGEFHDSLPLPFIETSKYMLVHRSKPALQTTDDCLTFPANLYSEIQGCTGIFNVPSLHRYHKLSPTVVDIFENFHLLVNASNWNQLSSNTSPCIIRVGHASDQVHTTDKAGTIPIFEASFNSDPDDLREPLALDNTPRPVIIEEISSIDQGGEQTTLLSLHKADANFPREIVGLCSSPEQLCHSNNVEDKDVETTCASTSVRETTNQLIDNDNLPTGIGIGSTTLRDNVENVEKEETNE